MFNYDCHFKHKEYKTLQTLIGCDNNLKSRNILSLSGLITDSAFFMSKG